MHLSKNYCGKRKCKIAKTFYKENIVLLHQGNKFAFECERVTQLPFGCNSKWRMFQYVMMTIGIEC